MAIPGRCERVVLVVEDDETIRESLAELLSDDGYHVVTAGNGVEALDELRRSPPFHPCLILLDLMMPVMNGQQFIEHTRLDPELAPIPIVVMSADGNLAEKAISFGSAYLAKPACIETVLGTIARHCAAGGHASEADVRL